MVLTRTDWGPLPLCIKPDAAERSTFSSHPSPFSRAALLLSSILAHSQVSNLYFTFQTSSLARLFTFIPSSSYTNHSHPTRHIPGCVSHPPLSSSRPTSSLQRLPHLFLCSRSRTCLERKKDAAPELVKNVEGSGSVDLDYLKKVMMIQDPLGGLTKEQWEKQQKKNAARLGPVPCVRCMCYRSVVVNMWCCGEVVCNGVSVLASARRSCSPS